MKFIKKHWLVEQTPVFESIPASGLNKARSTCCNVIVVAYKASHILLNLLKVLYVRVSVRIPWRGCIFKRWSHQCHVSSLLNLCTAWFQWSSHKTKGLICLCSYLRAVSTPALDNHWYSKFCLAQVAIPSALFGQVTFFPFRKVNKKSCTIQNKALK